MIDATKTLLQRTRENVAVVCPAKINSTSTFSILNAYVLKMTPDTTSQYSLAYS
jgi:hypothetical protein